MHIIWLLGDFYQVLGDLDKGGEERVEQDIAYGFGKGFTFAKGTCEQIYATRVGRIKDDRLRGSRRSIIIVCMAAIICRS